MSIKNEILTLIKSKTKLSSSVTETTHLYKDLHFDSLSYVSLLMAVVNHFNVTIGLPEMGRCLVVGQMIELVEEKIRRE